MTLLRWLNAARAETRRRLGEGALDKLNQELLEKLQEKKDEELIGKIKQELQSFFYSEKFFYACVLLRAANRRIFLGEAGMTQYLLDGNGFESQRGGVPIHLNALQLEQVAHVFFQWKGSSSISQFLEEKLDEISRGIEETTPVEIST